MVDQNTEKVTSIPNAWRVSADIDAPYLIAKPDGENLYSAIQPGDAMVLMTEDGEKAWGVRKVFMVRHENKLSVVCFDGGVDLEDEFAVPFAGAGDKTELRKMDFSLVEQMLADNDKPKFADQAIAMITSANLTGKAMEKNMELGILVKGGNIPKILHEHFTALAMEKTITKIH